jgi:hypothetical protein
MLITVALSEASEEPSFIYRPNSYLILVPDHPGGVLENGTTGLPAVLTLADYLADDWQIRRRQTRLQRLQALVADEAQDLGALDRDDLSALIGVALAAKEEKRRPITRALQEALSVLDKLI